MAGSGGNTKPGTLSGMASRGKELLERFRTTQSQYPVDEYAYSDAWTAAKKWVDQAERSTALAILKNHVLYNRETDKNLLNEARTLIDVTSEMIDEIMPGRLRKPR